MKDYQLPAKYYRLRTQVSEQIAACVLLCPERAPSRQQLPRAHISDPRLVEVLACSILARNSNEMAQLVFRQLGARYTCQLYQSLCGNYEGAVFLWNLDWYVHQLNYLERIEREHDSALRKAIEIKANAIQELNRY